MDIQWKIKIVDSLIAEDHDATIADYLQLVKELSSIATTSPPPIEKKDEAKYFPRQRGTMQQHGY